MKKTNFVFWGTPDVASETLEILKSAGFLPSLIVTSPDKPAGRKMLLTPPPAKVWAMENNIQYIQPATTAELGNSFSNNESVKARGSEKKNKTAKPDLFIVVAYGKIIPEKILNLPKLGSINIHYSLLPKYRGASPVESAILNGETETGVTIQKMVYEMDAGNILAQEKVAILSDETAPELRKRLIKIGGEMLLKILNPSAQKGTSPYLRGGWEGLPQDNSQATHCSKIKKEDGLVDLEASLPSELYNKFRAYATWPRTFFFKNSKRIIITDAKLENGQFVIKKVIPESGKETDWKN